MMNGAILHAQGWLAASWPSKWGGANWSFVQHYIFEVEAAIAYAPRIVTFGLKMFAPVVMKYGSDEQRRRWLPRNLDGSDWWCQGFSEPGAVSDLASRKTAAVRDGDHYIVNGQKSWTTLGHYANRIFCLVRTDPSARKQEGISFLAIDMDGPGVQLRPIRLLDGEHEVNEIFFTVVCVACRQFCGERECRMDLRQISSGA
jgi:alkylation response protein AidB-like acyl-CoA dehydrogenase